MASLALISSLLIIASIATGSLQVSPEIVSSSPPTDLDKLEMTWDGAIEFNYLNSSFTEEDIAHYQLVLRCLVVDTTSGAVVGRLESETGIKPAANLGTGIFTALQCPVDTSHYQAGRLYRVIANCAWVADNMATINCRPGRDEHIDLGTFRGQGQGNTSLYLPLRIKTKEDER